MTFLDKVLQKQTLALIYITHTYLIKHKNKHLETHKGAKAHTTLLTNIQSFLDNSSQIQKKGKLFNHRNKKIYIYIHKYVYIYFFIFKYVHKDTQYLIQNNIFYYNTYIIAILLTKRQNGMNKEKHTQTHSPINTLKHTDK